MTFQEYIDKANAYHAAHPEQRIGQAFMNTLRWVRADLFDALTDDVDVWEVKHAHTPKFWDYICFLEERWTHPTV